MSSGLSWGVAVPPADWLASTYTLSSKVVWDKLTAPVSQSVRQQLKRINRWLPYHPPLPTHRNPDPTNNTGVCECVYKVNKHDNEDMHKMLIHVSPSLSLSLARSLLIVCRVCMWLSPFDWTITQTPCEPRPIGLWWCRSGGGGISKPNFEDDSFERDV